MKPVEVFFSYSHQDEKLRDKLALHLSLLQRQGVIKSWHDRKISAGTEWAKAIDDHINSAEIILLLISNNFLASDYCYDIEMQKALLRHEAGDARVIPIILKPVDWRGAPFSKLQAFPKDAKPVTKWSNRDEAFVNIAQGIRQAAKEIGEFLRSDQHSALTENQLTSVPLDFNQKKNDPSKIHPRIVGIAPQGIDNSFKDRLAETAEITNLILSKNSDTRIITISGRGGIGKTALACKVMANLETKPNVNGLVYLSNRAGLKISLERVYLGCAQVLGDSSEQFLRTAWTDVESNVAEKIQILLSQSRDKRYVILLDNFEELLDKKTGRPINDDLRLFIDTFLQQKHQGCLLITSREPLNFSSSTRQYQHNFELENGLPQQDALTFLKECDKSGELIGDDDSDLLQKILKKTRSYPRALEAVISILFKAENSLISLNELLENEDLFAREVIDNLVREALTRLDSTEYQVMQALAVFERPVPEQAICFLLEPYLLNVDVNRLLKQLSRSHYIKATRKTKKVELQTMDRDSIYKLIPTDNSTDFNVKNLENRAAQYYADHHSFDDKVQGVEDLEPKIFEINHRCNAQEYDEAMEVLLRIDEHLTLWGAYNYVVKTYEDLHSKVKNEQLRMLGLMNLGVAYQNLGRYQQSILCYEKSLAIAHDAKNKIIEEKSLGNLANCYSELGQTDDAIIHFKQARLIAHEIKRWEDEGKWLCGLGTCYSDMGEIDRAIQYYNQALILVDRLGDMETRGACLGNLGNCYVDLGEFAGAISYYERALEIQSELGDQSGRGTFIHSLTELFIDQENYSKAIEFANEGIIIGNKLESPKILSANSSALARVYLCLGNLSAAYESTKIALNTNEAQNNHYVWLLLGLIELRRGNQRDACKAFRDTLVQVSDRLANNKKDYKAIYRKGIALCGLAICEDRDLIYEAVEVFHSARAINNSFGVIRRNVSLLKLVHEPEAEDLFSIALAEIEGR